MNEKMKNNKSKYFLNSLSLDSGACCLKAWGQNNFGVFGTYNENTVLTNPLPVDIPTAGIENFKSIEQISAGNNYALFAIKDTNDDVKLYYSGGSTPSNGIKPVSTSLKNCIYVSTNGKTHAAIFNNGSNNLAYLWGSNKYYQLGTSGYNQNTITFEESLNNNINGLKTPDDQSWKFISIGLLQTVGIAEDGTLYQWGSYGLHDLEKNDLAPSLSNIPQKISDYTDWVVAYAGNSTCLALRENGEMYVWNYKFGDKGNLTSQNTNFPFFNYPQKINDFTTWEKISVCGATYFAIDIYGYLYGWGLNNYNLLSVFGYGWDEPRKISYLPGWQDIKAGPTFAIATRKDLENLGLNSFTYAWGYNLGGVFGNGLTENSNVSYPWQNQNQNFYSLKNINNLSGQNVFATVPELPTTTTTTVEPSSVFSNWMTGDLYSATEGRIKGLTSGIVWGATAELLNNIYITLSNNTKNQTHSFFYKKNISSSNFILGEQLLFYDFPNDVFAKNASGKNVNGTYYLTETKINGSNLYHKISANPISSTTTTTTLAPKTLKRQELSAFFKLYYSGGNSNNDAAKSLGGNISNFIILPSKNNIFNNVSGDIYEEGLTDYRCVYLKNNSENRVLYLYFALDDFFLGSIQNLGFNFTNEVQTITVLNGPFTNGQNIVFSYNENNFIVEYDTNFNQWLINFNASIKQVFGLEDVIVTGDSNGSNSIFQVSFQGTAGYKNHSLITLVGYDLSPTPSISIVKSITGSPINLIAEKIITSTNEPNNITFYDATINSPVYLPILNPGDFLPIWLRRTIYPNTIAIENDGGNLIITGNYEVIEE